MQLTIFDQPNLEEEHAEMLLFLLKKRELEKTPQGYFWKDTKEPLGQRTFYDAKCPYCGESASKHPINYDGQYDKRTCHWVLGRRGWRQLGDYDS